MLSMDLWTIIRPYHTDGLQRNDHVLRCELHLQANMMGEINVMKGSKEDCYVEKTLISWEKSQELFNKLKDLLKMGDLPVEEAKIRIEPEVATRVNITYSLI